MYHQQNSEVFSKKDNIVTFSKNRHNSDSRLSLNLFWCMSFPRNKKCAREEKTLKSKTTNTGEKRGIDTNAVDLTENPFPERTDGLLSLLPSLKKEGRFSEDFCFFFASSFVSN